MICGCYSDIVIIHIIILGLLLTLFYQSSIETNDFLDVEFFSFLRDMPPTILLSRSLVVVRETILVRQEHRQQTCSNHSKRLYLFALVVFIKCTCFVVFSFE